MTLPPTIEDTARIFRDGVESVGLIASHLDGDSWDREVCGQWTATQTARHLLAVARWYHEWLSRAVAGDASFPFPAGEMDQRNEVALAAVSDLSGPEAVTAFTETAVAYLGRAVEHWDLPFGYPFGTVTVGLHCGVAAAEWQLHAWDLSGATLARHRPQDPQGLFLAAGWCVASAQGGIKGAALRRLIPLGSRREPWISLLKRSGRDPSS